MSRRVASRRLLDAVRIPALVTWLLARGLETPLLIQLAGMDLKPFLEIDASELFHELLVELAVLPFERPDEVRVALGAASAVFLDEGLTIVELMKIGEQLAPRYDYPRAATHLGALGEEWEGGWFRTKDVIEREVKEMAMEALRESPEALACDPEFLRLALSSEP